MLLLGDETLVPFFGPVFFRAVPSNATTRYRVLLITQPNRAGRKKTKVDLEESVFGPKMLNEKEKEGCRQMLNKLNLQELLSLADTVTRKQITVTGKTGTRAK